MKNRFAIIILIAMIALTGCNRTIDKQNLPERTAYPPENTSENNKTNTTSVNSTSEDSIQNNSTKGISQSNTTLNTPENNTYGIKVGDKIKIAGMFQLKSRPEASTADAYNFTEKDKEYLVEEVKGIYVKIYSDKISGWLPAWYLSKEALNIEENVPELMLVKEFTYLYLIPEKTDLKYTDTYSLQEGQAVTVKRKYHNWYNVEFVLNDAATTGDRWVKDEFLMEYDPAKSREGVVQKGAKIYDDQFKIREGENFDEHVVTIQGEAEDPILKKSFYYVTGAGGFTGYIEKKDFIPYKSTDK